MGLHVALDQLVLDDRGVVVALGRVLLGMVVITTVAGAVAVAVVLQAVLQAVPVVQLQDSTTLALAPGTAVLITGILIFRRSGSAPEATDAGTPLVDVDHLDIE